MVEQYQCLLAGSTTAPGADEFLVYCSLYFDLGFPWNVYRTTMSRPEQAEEKLDGDFVLSVSLATSALRRLRRHDQSLCQKWLHKLCAEPVTGQAAKEVRNIYMLNLALQMQEASIKSPFTSPPPVGKLKSPGAVFPPEKRVTKEPAWLQDILRGTGADLLHSSNDGRTYMSSRHLKNGRGAMTYLAVSTADEEPLFLKPSKIASALQRKVSDSRKKSSSSLCTSSKESISEDQTLWHRKKPDKCYHGKTLAEAPKHKQALPCKSRSPSDTQRSQSPMAVTSKVSIIVDTAPQPEVAREQTPRCGQTLSKLFKFPKTASHRLQQTVIPSTTRVVIKSVHLSSDPSAESGSSGRVKVDVAKRSVTHAKTQVRKPSCSDGAAPKKDDLKKRQLKNKGLPEKFLLPPQRKPSSTLREDIILERAISIKVQPGRSHHRMSPDAKGSEHKVEVAVSYKRPSEKSLLSSSKSSLSRSEGSDDSDDSLGETLSSLQELFARRGTPNERSEVLRMFDDLIRNATKVLEGQEKPTPMLMVMLRKIAPCYSHLVNAMPVKSRILWLLTLLKEKLISQRTQFVMRITKLDSIQTAVKKKSSAKIDVRQLHPKFGDVDPVWRAEVARMPTPRNMRRLKQLYHPEVINCFLNYLIQEKINILDRHKHKLNKKEHLMKDEMHKEMKDSIEQYNQARKACEEVKYVVDQISRAMNGAKLSAAAELKQDKLSQDNMETRYSAMSRDIQGQLDKADATLKFEKLRSRDLSNMIEAEKKKLQQKEDMFRESMATKEIHKNSLQEEIKRLSREIDAHTQKIIDLNKKL